MEKELATHSSIITWKIPWTEEPDRLQSMGSHRKDKKNKIMLFAATWMDLDTVILIELSQTEKDKYQKIPLICGI